LKSGLQVKEESGRSHRDASDVATRFLPVGTMAQTMSSVANPKTALFRIRYPSGKP
jgi:hypothetical protein